MTTYLVDTSVAVPLVVASHTAHQLVTAALRRRRVYLAGHAAVETYSVLTRLPGDARLQPEDALRLLGARFAGTVEPAVTGVATIGQLVEAGIAGGAAYDGLVALAALGAERPVLYSRDARAAGTYSRVGVTFRLLA